MSSQYTRMTIGECLSEEQVKEFTKLTQDHISELSDPHGAWKGFVSARLLTEEGGRMVVLETTWDSRDNCLGYHSSRAYRQLVAKTQHLLLGDFVVKLFASTPDPVLEYVRTLELIIAKEWTEADLLTKDEAKIASHLTNRLKAEVRRA